MLEEVKAEIEDAKEYTKHHKRKVRDGIFILIFGLITISGGLFVGKNVEKKEENKEVNNIVSIDLNKELGESKYNILSNQDLNISEDVYENVINTTNDRPNNIYTLEDSDLNYKYIFTEYNNSIYVFDFNGKYISNLNDKNYKSIKGIYEFNDSYYVEYISYDKSNCISGFNLFNITNNKYVNLYNVKDNNCK